MSNRNPSQKQWSVQCALAVCVVGIVVAVYGLVLPPREHLKSQRTTQPPIYAVAYSGPALDPDVPKEIEEDDDQTSDDPDVPDLPFWIDQPIRIVSDQNEDESGDDLFASFQQKPIQLRPLRKNYPLVSLKKVLAKMKPAWSPPAILPDPLSVIEGYYGTLPTEESDNGVSESDVRRLSLWQLHSKEVARFVRASGFGGGRMNGYSPGPVYLDWQQPPLVPRATIPQSVGERVVKVDPLSSPSTDGELFRKNLPTEWDLRITASRIQYAFAEPATLGYVKNRAQIAGFIQHGFYEIPDLKLDHYRGEFNDHDEWRISRLELVSLLLHEKPVVYVSEHLPQMKELTNHPETRSLDEFETFGLDQLAEGRTIVYRAELNQIELLGAVRAVKHCLQCHDGQPGSLLGAFRYTLTRDPSIRLVPRSQKLVDSQ